MKSRIVLLFTLCVCTTALSQVNLQTGAAQFSLPLYSINNPNNRMGTTISLDYTAGNGLKVSELASSVGTGWALDIGGVIARVQNGEPDDQKQDEPFNVGYNDWLYLNYYYPNGYLYSTVAPSTPVTNAGGYTRMYLSAGTEYKPPKVLLEDREQDRFAFTINGRSGEFIIGRDFQIKTIVDSRLKIVAEYTNMNSQGIRTRISKFEVTDETGIKYVFKDLELSEVLKYDQRYPVPSGTPSINWYQTGGSSGCTSWFNCKKATTARGLGSYIVSKWYLSEIVNPSTGNKITYSYEGYPVEKQGMSIFAGSQQGNAQVSYDLTLLKIKGVAKRIKTITLFDEQVVFNYSAGFRYDLSYDKYLETIDVFYNQKLKKRWKFKYGYLHVNEIMPPTHDFYSNWMPGYQRLCLLSVQQTGLNNEISSPYEFSYYLGNPAAPNGEEQVPAMFSYRQDDWGYSNATYAVWQGDQYDYRGDDMALYLEDYAYKNVLDNTPHYRQVQNKRAQYGIIKSITYPTGGSLTYEYEQNSILYNGANKLVGGVRVSKTILFDGRDESMNIVTEYKYINENNLSSGWGYEPPVYSKSYGVRLYRCGDYKFPGINFGQVASAMPSLYKLAQIIAIKTTGEVVSPLVGMIGGFVVGVVINFLVNNLAYLLADPTKDFALTAYSPFALNYVNPLPVQYSRVEVRTTNSNANGKTIYEFTSDASRPIEVPVLNFPYSSKQRLAHWVYGLPKSVTVYDKNSNLKKKTINYYNHVVNTLNNSNNVSQKWAAEYKIFDCDDYHLSSSATYNITHDIYYPIYGRSELIKTEDYTYGDDGQSSLTTTHYEYSPSNYQLKTVKTNNTKGELVETLTMYAEDYSTSIPVIQPIKDANMVNVPIATFSYITKDGSKKMTGGSVSDFNTAPNNDFKIIRTYTFQSNVPVAASLVPVTSGAIIPSTDYFKSDKQYLYDTKGALIQVDRSGAKASTIFDYSGQLPIALIANAAVSDVAFSSFEGDATGNWVKGQNATILEDRGFTGVKSLKGIISKAVTQGDYVLSLWCVGNASVNGQSLTQTPTKTIGQWKFFELSLSNVSTVTVQGDNIDEVKLYPKGAQMTTYTYDPLIGKIAEGDVRNQYTFYQYDGLGRLKTVRDEQWNVLKAYEYNYRTVFYSGMRSAEFRKNNCPPNHTGTLMNYTVPAGKYSSLISQQDADSKADNDLQQNGQAYANNPANGAVCYPNPVYPVLTYENMSPDGMYADIVVRFYSDPGHTTLTTVSNYQLTYYVSESCNSGWSSTTTNQLTVNGTSTITIASQAQLYFNSSYWDQFCGCWLTDDCYINYSL